MRTKQYEDYINSFDWHLKRSQALSRADQKCGRCGSTEGLEVHHLTYERLGNEEPEDLLVVCRSCHEKEDDKRRWQVEEQQYLARLDGWASKKYGEDWESWKDATEVAEQFEKWLEKKEEEEY